MYTIKSQIVFCKMNVTLTGIITPVPELTWELQVEIDFTQHRSQKLDPHKRILNRHEKIYVLELSRWNPAGLVG